ncbi:DUF2169 family type VI secretion system accessory protein [Sorangium sp. So ce887]|uniref:DUF2169 family type VI secretion system accessory protein n=1 Tax=Sorangium sp. So ce887 TaxID=3133324 RepID=UPI003F5DF31D
MLHGAARHGIAPDQVIALPGATAAAVAWRTRGQLHVTVIAKATFAFASDAEMPRSAPQEIFEANVHHGKDPSRSLRFTSDLVPYLGRADVLFTGHACAPPGISVLALSVRLALFDRGREILDKRLLVQDRVPFRSLPLVYERAVRGANGQENPLGVDAGAGPEQPTVLGIQAPHRPAGYGPVVRGWPTFWRLIGDTPRSSMIDASIQEIPEHFDWSCFQSAPPDQRVDSLRGGEWIVLQGLHPTVPHLRMRLPELRGLARVHGLSAFGVGDGQGLALCIDTLRIDGEEQRCTLVFRRSFPLASEAALARMRLVVGVEQAGAPLAWPPRIDVRALPEREAAPAGGVASAGAGLAPGATGGALKGVAAAAVTAEIDEGALPDERRPVHPFRLEGATTLEPRLALARAKTPLWAASTLEVEDLPEQALRNARAFPFQEQLPGLLPAPPLNAAETRTIKVRIASGTRELALDQPPGAGPGSAVPFLPPGVVASAHATGAMPASPVQSVADKDTWSSGDTAPGPWLGVPAAPPGAVDQAVPSLSRAEGPVEYVGWPAEPPLLALAAERAPAVRSAPAPAPGTVPYFDPAALASPAAPPAPAPEPALPEPDPVSFPIELFAAINAEIAEARAPRAAVLASHALGERAWSAIERHWTSAIKSDAGHGPGRLRSAYDSTYVATVEAFRGPILPAEYARLVVGVERKQSDRVLDELGIQRPALMHVIRLWTKKAAADPRIFREVGAALSALRGQ